MIFPRQRAVIELDAAALTRNYGLLSSRAGRARMIAVVKANAYGHGTEFAVRTLTAAGCVAFAVATLTEAVTVRLLAPRALVLLLGYTPPEEVGVLAELGLAQTVFSAEYARELHAALRQKAPKTHHISVHFKIDCGMARLGLPAGAAGAAEIANIVASCNGFTPAGVFGHLPSVEAVAATDAALARFGETCTELAKNHHIGGLMRHVAASAALLGREDARFDAVRPGLALWGYAPVETALPLAPVMRLHAPVVQCHDLPAGAPVGYGGDFVTARPTRIGVVPLGYGDGIPRALSGFSVPVLHHGRRYFCPILGRVCMDFMMLDLTDTPAGTGDAVFPFDDLPAAARHAKTIPYELLCGVRRGSLLQKDPPALAPKP